jgi:hypothetical protein
VGPGGAGGPGAPGGGRRRLSLPIERIRDLRYIKNELNVLRRLDRCERFADPAVQRWLALWPQLP